MCVATIQQGLAFIFSEQVYFWWWVSSSRDWLTLFLLAAILFYARKRG
jgi:hypothetical protein